MANVGRLETWLKIYPTIIHTDENYISNPLIMQYFWLKIVHYVEKISSHGTSQRDIHVCI